MIELRDSYKRLIMDAARIAVKGGTMTLPFEDFIIDYMDELIDSLGEDEFHDLVLNEKLGIKRIINDSEYVRYSEWIAIAENTLLQPVNQFEIGKLLRYIEILKEETTDYERRFNLHELLECV